MAEGDKPSHLQRTTCNAYEVPPRMDGGVRDCDESLRRVVMIEATGWVGNKDGDTKVLAESCLARC